jgi:hypothetical protein
MTRQEGRTLLVKLAAGLAVDDAGVRRLLERIAERDQCEELRALLVEAGARAFLNEHGDAADGGNR